MIFWQEVIVWSIVKSSRIADLVVGVNDGEEESLAKDEQDLRPHEANVVVGYEGTSGDGAKGHEAADREDRVEQDPEHPRPEQPLIFLFAECRKIENKRLK